MSLADFARERRSEPAADRSNHSEEVVTDRPPQEEPEHFDALSYWQEHLKSARPGTPQYGEALRQIRALQAEAGGYLAREGRCPTCGHVILGDEEREELLSGIVAALDNPSGFVETPEVKYPPIREPEDPELPADSIPEIPEVEEVEEEAPEQDFGFVPPAARSILSGEADSYFDEPPVERVSVMPKRIPGVKDRTGQTLGPRIARGNPPHGSHAALEQFRGAW
jgi:hypothetical protein